MSSRTWDSTRQPSAPAGPTVGSRDGRAIIMAVSVPGRGCPVGRTERWLRRLIKPWSTRATAWWCDSALRRRLQCQQARRVHRRQQRRPLVDPRMVGDAAAATVTDGVTEVPVDGRGPRRGIHHGDVTSTDRAALLVGAGMHGLRRRLAGSLGARAGRRRTRRALWYGQRPRPDVMLWWVRVWYALPLLDRYAHAWMWAHGGWEVRPPLGAPPGDHAGVREPREPVPPGRQSGAALAIPQTEQQPH
jgi:hypothetical protein